MAQPTLEIIQEFLNQKRFALIGVSRDPKSFSRQVFKEFRKRNYEVIPVNPVAADVEGIPCFPQVQNIGSPVPAAMIVTTPDQTEATLQDCAAAGIRFVWVRGKDGQTALSPKAKQICEENQIRVIDGYCPIMFLPGAAFPHRVHGFITKLIGKYPKKN